MIAHTLRAMVNLILTVMIALLGVRFVFKLFAASPNNQFVSWVYETSAGLVAPFSNIFTPMSIQNGYVIEFSALVAMLAYTFVGMLAFLLIDMLTTVKIDEPRRYDALRDTN